MKMLTEGISIQSYDGHTFGALVGSPAKAPAPVIVIAQEIFGVNAFARQAWHRGAAGRGAPRAQGLPDRKSTRLNSSHSCASRMPSSACKKKQNTTSITPSHTSYTPPTQP